MTTGRTLLVAALAALASPLAAASTPGADSFDDRLEVVEVPIPLQVLDRDGQPVRGLTREDFAVWVDGQRRPVQRLEVFDLDAASSEPLPGAVPATEASPSSRHVLFVFDLSFSSPAAVGRAREALREVLLAALAPDDLAAIATYAIETGPQLLVTFTRDRSQLARAIDALAFDRLGQGLVGRDPLRFLAPLPQASAAGNAGAGVDRGSELRQELEAIQEEEQEAIARNVQREQQHIERGRVSTWTRDLARLARLLDAVPGRKQVVLLSEGFDSSLLLGRNDLADAEAIDTTSRRLAGEIWEVDSDARFGSTRLQGEAQRLVDALRRADCVLQAIDIGGLRAGGEARATLAGNGRDALFFLADASGGQLVEGANDLGGALRSALDRSTVTYRLTVLAGDLPADGSYHQLRVEVPGRRGLEISHRAGFYAPRPFAELHPLERSLLAADAIVSPTPPATLPIHLLVAAFGRAPQALVPVILEIPGESLERAGSGPSRRLELYVYASDPRGTIVGHFSRTLELARGGGEPADPAPAAAPTGLKYYGTLHLPAGRFLVRALVRETALGTTGVATAQVEVPGGGQLLPRLTPPLLLDADRAWTLAREPQSPAADGALVYPYVADGEPFIPQAVGLGRSGQALRLCAFGYDLASPERTPTLSLLTADGSTRWTAPFATARREAGTPAAVSKWCGRWEVPTLPAGDYALRVEGATEGPSPVGAEIPFRVVSNDPSIPGSDS
jgi:VWFA-related protein